MESEIIEIFEEVLEPIGFCRSKFVWRRHRVESIDVIDLQKSDYDNLFYVNLGIFFPQLGDLKNPPTYKCHIQVRLNRLHPEPQLLENILDQSEKWKVEKSERIGIVKYGIVEAEKLFFNRFSTLNAAAAFVPLMSQYGFAVSAPLYHYWERTKR